MGPKEKLIDNLSDAYAFYLEGHSFSDVGAKFGVSHSTVRRTFLRHGFITRSRKESVTDIVQQKLAATQFQKGSEPHNKGLFILSDKQCEEALELYISGWSFADIGRLFNCSWSSVHNLFKTRGYYIRTKQEQQLIPHIKAASRKAQLGRKHTPAAIERMRGREPHNKHKISHELIIRLYKRYGSSEIISKKIPLSANAIRQTLKLNGVKLNDPPSYFRQRMLALPRHEHPNWRGGTTPLAKLARNHTRYLDWRRSVLQKFDYKCALSGLGGTLEVHHSQIAFADIVKKAMEDLQIRVVKPCDYRCLVARILDINEECEAIPLRPEIHNFLHQKKAVSLDELKQDKSAIKEIVFKNT